MPDSDGIDPDLECSGNKHNGAGFTDGSATGGDTRLGNRLAVVARGMRRDKRAPRPAPRTNASARKCHGERHCARQTIARFCVIRPPDANWQLLMEFARQTEELPQAARSEYVTRRENIIALGNSGTGKTHIALGLGLATCQKGLAVGFTTAAALVNELHEARDEKRLLRLQRQLAGYKLHDRRRTELRSALTDRRRGHQAFLADSRQTQRSTAAHTASRSIPFPPQLSTSTLSVSGRTQVRTESRTPIMDTTPSVSRSTGVQPRSGEGWGRSTDRSHDGDISRKFRPACRSPRFSAAT